MLRFSFTRVHVAPASSLRKRPPLSFSTRAYTRFEFAPDTDTPIRPTSPAGSPGLRVISVHVSPPSVLLNSPLPAPPLDIWYSLRYASHIAAYITSGLWRSIAMSIAAVRSSRKSTLRQVAPPSLLLYTPRSVFGALSLPKAATNTTCGLVGWMRIFEITLDDAKPTFVHVLPPSRLR